MQRDPELIRKLLLDIEASESPGAPDALRNESRVDDRLGYHCWLLYDAGLIEAVEIGMTNSRHFKTAMPLHLTSRGHDFIDSVKDESTWNSVKSRVAGAGRALGTLTLDVIKAVAIDVTKGQLGLPAA